MTISPFLIYMIDLVNSISVMFCIIFFLSLVVAGIFLMARSMAYGDEKDRCDALLKKHFRKFLIISLGSLFLATILPGKDTFWKMIIIPKAIEITQSPQVANEIKYLLDQIHNKLEDKK